jgi:hypothetical protein
MNKFESNISRIINEEVVFQGKAALKQRLLQKHIVADPFLAKLKQDFNAVTIPAQVKMLLKEKLILIANVAMPSLFDRVLNSVRVKKLAASFAVFALILSLVFQPFTSVNTVKASSPTRITNFSGDVKVNRSGELFEVQSEFVLTENDIIQTGENSKVEVVFADESLLRLGDSTRLLISNLDNEVINSNNSIKLVSGELWVNTLGLAGSQASFEVNAGELTAEVQDSAVFDLEVTESYSRVVSLDNSVNLQLYDDGVFIPANLRKGQLVKVKKETPYNTYLDKMTFEDRLSDFDLDWFTKNFESDVEYRSKISESRSSERKAKAGLTPDSLFYPVKEFQRAAQLAVTFDPIKQSELEISIANQKLFEAEVLISRGKMDSAKKLLADYSADLSRVASTVQELNKNVTDTNKQQFKDLKNNLVESVNLQKKSFRDVLPTEEVYDVKMAINEAELLVAGSEVEKKKVELAQAKDILVEARELAKTNNPELVSESLDRYFDKIEQISSEVAELDEADKGELVTTVLDGNVTGIQALEELKVEVSKSALIQTQTAQTITFDQKLEEATAKSVSTLTEVLDKASQVKDPEVLTQVRKVSETLNLNSASTVQTGLSNSVIVEDVEIPTTVIPETPAVQMQSSEIIKLK